MYEGAGDDRSGADTHLECGMHVGAQDGLLTPRPLELPQPPGAPPLGMAPIFGARDLAGYPPAAPDLVPFEPEPRPDAEESLPSRRSTSRTSGKRTTAASGASAASASAAAALSSVPRAAQLDPPPSPATPRSRQLRRTKTVGSTARKQRVGIGEAAGIRLSVSHTASSAGRKTEVLPPRDESQVVRKVKPCRTEATSDDVIRELGLELNGSNQRLVILRQSLEAAHQNSEAVVDRLREAHRRIDELEGMREEDRKKWLDTVECWRKHMDENDEKATKERDALTAERDSFENQARAANEMERDVNQAKAKLNEATAEGEGVVGFNGADGVQGCLVDMADGVQSVVIAMKGVVNALQVEKDRLETTVRELTTSVQTYSRRECEYEQRLEAMSSEARRVEEVAIQAAEEQQQEQCRKLSAMRDQFVLQQRQYEANIADLRIDLSTAATCRDEQIVALTHGYDATIAELEAELFRDKQTSTDAIDAMKNEILQLEATLKEQSEQADQIRQDADNQLAEKRRELQEIAKQLTGLEEQAQECMAERALAKTNEACFLEQVEALQSKLKDYELQMLKKDRLILSAAEREACLRKQCDEAAVKHAALQEQKAGLEKVAEALQIQLTAAQRRSDQAEHSAAAAERQSRRRQSELERVREELAVKDAHLEDLRHKALQHQLEAQQLRARVVDSSLAFRRGMPEAAATPPEPRPSPVRLVGGSPFPALSPPLPAYPPFPTTILEP
ncbi:hypothetical protein DIPPA_14484 [Diplonema papillatum]|nr:hypothetical protein DIPPA_14484 [Diplonema papillatum]